MAKQPTLLFALPEGFHILRNFVSVAEQREMIAKCGEMQLNNKVVYFTAYKSLVLLGAKKLIENKIV